MIQQEGHVHITLIESLLKPLQGGLGCTESGKHQRKAVGWHVTLLLQFQHLMDVGFRRSPIP